jgi:putative tricarboxylic transport membrane protein
MSGKVTGSDPLKGWIMGFLGLFVAQIGQDGIHAHNRFTFGNSDLAGGLSLIPTLVGAFGFAEVLTVMKDKASRPMLHAVDSILPRIADVFRYWRTILRSGVIGVYVGILPGVGEDMAAWSSYAAAKRASKEREKFGKGSIEGLIAAETGDNASVPGAIIPALALAIPGSAPAAVLLAAMIIHGVRPGPMLMVESPQFVYDVVEMNLLATIGILFFGLFLVRPLLLVLQIPRTIIMTVVFVLCTVGSFAIASRLFDVWTMVFVGICGFGLRLFNYQMAPFVLGLVLGDILDKSLRRGLVLSDGDLTPFFMRPISGFLAAIVAIMLLSQFRFFNDAVARAKTAALGLVGRKN